jgi:hypothetical protein
MRRTRPPHGQLQLPCGGQVRYPRPLAEMVVRRQLRHLGQHSLVTLLIHSAATQTRGGGR